MSLILATHRVSQSHHDQEVAVAHELSASGSSAAKKIEWAELKFPPINLWVLAGSTVLSNGFESTRNHRLQRPGMKGNHANSLRYFKHEQMKTILATHGGKR